MFADPNRLYLGGETYNDDAVIYFVDGDEVASTPDHQVDPDDWTVRWSIDASGNAMSFRDEQADTDLLTLGADGASFGEGMALGGDITDVNVVDDMIRFSGFSDVFEFRRSESDWDQMLEFRRQSNSDYELYLHRGGSPHEVLTDDHAVDAATFDGNAPDEFLLGGLEASNDGSLVHDSVYTLNFGQDLGVSATTDGVTVEYVGATIPAVVYDNGNEVLGDANGIDFLSGLSVTAGTNDVAEIEVDLPGGLLEADSNEQVTGEWEFTQTVLGSIEHAAEADTAAFANDIDSALIDSFTERDVSESIGPMWTFGSGLGIADGEDLVFGSDDDFRMRYSSTTDNFVFETDVDGAATAFATVNRGTEVINSTFELQQNGDTVATEAWVENSADVLGTDEQNTFTAEQTFTGNIDASQSDYIALPEHDTEPDYSSWPDGAIWYQTNEV